MLVDVATKSLSRQMERACHVFTQICQDVGGTGSKESTNWEPAIYNWFIRNLLCSCFSFCVSFPLFLCLSRHLLSLTSEPFSGQRISNTLEIQFVVY